MQSSLDDLELSLDFSAVLFSDMTHLVYPAAPESAKLTY